MGNIKTEAILSGIKVLDLGHYIAGPYAAKLLADNGADVIKIERPAEVDISRWCGPFPKDVPDPEASGLFLSLNTSKKGITLDITLQKGKNLFLELVKKANVIIENFKPGLLPSLGLGYNDLARVNPRLVMTSISNFGQSGPYSNYEATEITFQASGGLMALTGEPDRPPLRIGIPLAHYLSGLTASGALFFVALGLGSALALIFGYHLNVSAISAIVFDGVDSYILLALPLFILAGTLLNEGGGVAGLMKFSDAMIGHIRGGLFAATAAFCAVFSALSGSGYATCAAAGTTMIPQMLKRGYTEEDTGGLVAAAATLGDLHPPEHILRSLWRPVADTGGWFVCRTAPATGKDPSHDITLFITPAKSSAVICYPQDTIGFDHLSQIEFVNLVVDDSDMLGEVDKGWPVVQKLLDWGAMGKCAEMIGASDRALEMSLEYAKERVQYGRHIGSFQKQQHRLADMWIALEGSRNFFYEAGWSLSSGSDDAMCVSAAKAMVSAMAEELVDQATLLHGAIGLSWDYDLGFLLRRIRAASLMFGNPRYHYAIIARELEEKMA